jgi:endoglucanase
MINQRKLSRLLVIITLVGTLMASVPVLALAMPQSSLDSNTQFYVPKPNPGATEQIANLISSHNTADANLIRRMIKTPQAVWFTKGTPESVEQNVKKTVERALGQGAVPVLVAYNIPFRDCAQFSAGGATNLADYKAWIDGFAAGIGNNQAVVILEPDGLGIIPFYTTFYSGMEWCQPKDSAGNPLPEADPAHRFEALNYAVDALEAKPNTSVYLDGTHARWLGPTEAANRLILAGVQRAEGFYTNISNYQSTETSLIHGRWVSACIEWATNPASWAFGHPEWCPSGQYDPTLGYKVNYDPAYVATVDAAFTATGVSATTHFVIDTSRNGQGFWTPTASYPDSQDWCNPPDRGVGLRPTANTGVPLADAYLWVKIPGESDGQCTRGLGSTGTVDPEWDIVDPAAGAWFPEMALELVHNANPPLP